MKKLIKRCLFILGLFLSLNLTFADDYKYTNLNIDADVLIDGTINVKETYTADFYVKKHGIYRNIPLNYSVDGNKFHIDISNINVDGKKYTTKRRKGEWVIKIGDPDVQVYGEVVYPISYTVYGLIKNFSGMGYGELYWNLVGYGFDTSIAKVSAVIDLPKIYTGFTSSDFLITTDGMATTVEQFAGKVDRSQGDKIIITYDKNLPANHGITLAVKFPNNYFEFDHEKQEDLIGNANIGSFIKEGFSSLIQDSESLMYIFFFVIVGVIIILGKIGKLGKRIDLKSYKLKGKLARKYHTVIQYDPPKGLNSAEVGLLLHRNGELKDLLSLIYKRAAEGLVTINADTKKNIFGKTVLKSIKINKVKEISDSVPDFEKKFFRSFLLENGTELVGYSKQHITIVDALEKHGINQGWFTKRDNKRIIIYIILFILLCVFGNIFGFLIAIIFALIFQKKLNSEFDETEKGAELIAYILGYRKFLAKCDEKQLRTFLAQDPLFFDKTLPYAVVFGLETQFLNKMIPIMEDENIHPMWYTGSLDNMCKISTVTDNISYSNSKGFSGGSSFGGGFSGGGGGGGGGGGSR